MGNVVAVLLKKWIEDGIEMKVIVVDLPYCAVTCVKIGRDLVDRTDPDVVGQ